MNVSGLFETIRSHNGQLEFLDAHLERLQRACETVGWGFPGRDYEGLIAESLREKGLDKRLTRVRLVVKRGDIVIEAQPYTLPPDEQYTQGISLKVMPHPNPTPSARIKSCDRQSYDEALRQAQRAGFDECLFIHEGRILEGAAVNVIVIHGGKCFIPSRNDFRLAGIMEQEALKTFGLPIIEGDITLPLPEGSKTYITNSLKGILPVRTFVPSS